MTSSRLILVPLAALSHIATFGSGDGSTSPARARGTPNGGEVDGTGASAPIGTGGVGTGGAFPGSGGMGAATSGGAPGTGGGSGGNTSSGGGNPVGSGTILLAADFSGATVGAFSEAMVETEFGIAPPWSDGLDQGRGSIVDQAGDKFLRVTYPATQFGPAAGGIQFRMNFGQAYHELYFAYRVRFAAGFDFVKGGKLPGLMGGSAPSGCSPKDDGFSARNMWRTGGQAVQYVYYPDQPNTCGDDLDYKVGGEDQFFTPGTWHTVVHHVVMNDVGQANGVFEAWLDGKQTLAESNRVWEIASAPYDGIDALYFSTFFGGGDSSWAPATAQIADFDDFVVSTGPISVQ